MLKKIVFLCFLNLLLLSCPVFALNFEEQVYKSVVVIYVGNSIGSGFAIGNDCVITNAHVIKNAKNITLGVYKEKDYESIVVKVDENMDLAVLKIIDKRLPYLKIADNDSLVLGSDVFAIGAPKDMQYTLTKGIISAKDRIINGKSFIQTDASINPGNSGGPLINSKGEVVGVNSLKLSNAEGIGLAIPINLVLQFLDNNNITINEQGNIEARSTIEPKNEDVKSNGLDDQIDYLKQRIITLRIIIIILIVLIAFLIIAIILLVLNMKKKDNILKTINSKEYDFEIELKE